MSNSASKISIVKSYRSSFVLLAGIFAGSLIGFMMGEKASVFKPLGDIFLNLLFTVVVPLVFFSISSAVAGLANSQRLFKIISAMLGIFILTGIASSLIMVTGVKNYPPARGIELDLKEEFVKENVDIPERIVRAFTVTDFGELLSKKSMLPLILFGLLVGLAAGGVKEKGEPFLRFLRSGNDVMMKVVAYIMMFAPVGLGAYFAHLVGAFGPQLLGTYGRVVAIYYPLAIGYFFVGFTVYAYLAAGKSGIKSFWSNIIPTSLVAFGTGSSIATIPSNLESAKKIGVPEDIREIVIPIGSTIHMDGSCLAAILKISVLFGIYHMDFAGWQTIGAAVGIALLSGTVMSGIPGGGFLGEIMIVSMYGFPVEALVIISMVGALVDPPATMVNAVGDNVASMMVSRILGGPKWMRGES